MIDNITAGDSFLDHHINQKNDMCNCNGANQHEKGRRAMLTPGTAKTMKIARACHTKEWLANWIDFPNNTTQVFGSTYGRIWHRYIKGRPTIQHVDGE